MARVRRNISITSSLQLGLERMDTFLSKCERKQPGSGVKAPIDVVFISNESEGTRPKQAKWKSTSAIEKYRHSKSMERFSLPEMDNRSQNFRKGSDGCSDRGFRRTGGKVPGRLRLTRWKSCVEFPNTDSVLKKSNTSVTDTNRSSEEKSSKINENTNETTANKTNLVDNKKCANFDYKRYMQTPVHKQSCWVAGTSKNKPQDDKKCYITISKPFSDELLGRKLYIDDAPQVSFFKIQKSRLNNNTNISPQQQRRLKQNKGHHNISTSDLLRLSEKDFRLSLLNLNANGKCYGPMKTRIEGNNTQSINAVLDANECIFS